MCCLCIQFTLENTSERTILHLVGKKIQTPPFQVWLLALQKRLAMPLDVMAAIQTYRSPKFMSFWRGPFQITRKLSEVLYEVNCGREGQRQIIHCDRLRRKIVQNLRGENDVETSVENELDEVVNDLESESLEEVDDLVQESRRPKRVGIR